MGMANGRGQWTRIGRTRGALEFGASRLRPKGELRCGNGDRCDGGGFEAEDTGTEVSELPTVAAQGIAFIG